MHLSCEHVEKSIRVKVPTVPPQMFIGYLLAYKVNNLKTSNAIVKNLKTMQYESPQWCTSIYLTYSAGKITLVHQIN